MKYQEYYGDRLCRNKPDLSRCASSVSSDGLRYHQCNKKALYEPDENGKPTTCKIHSAEYSAEKRRLSDEKYQKWKEDRRIPNNAHAFHEALVEIAGGHNDPRGLAMTTLAKATA